MNQQLQRETPTSRPPRVEADATRRSGAEQQCGQSGVLGFHGRPAGPLRITRTSGMPTDPKPSPESRAPLDPLELAAILEEVRRVVLAVDAGTGNRQAAPAVDADTKEYRPLRDITLTPVDSADTIDGL
jgi:hypothetical protein